MQRVTDDDLEGVCRNYRKHIGFEDVPKLDMVLVLERTQREYRGFRYERVSSDEMADAEAKWNSFTRVMSIRDSVWSGVLRGESRANMTVSHELIHFVLKHEGVLNRSITKTIAEQTVFRTKMQESEARRAAPILLAPAYLAPEELSVEALQEIFGLSLQAAVLRVPEIEAVRRRAAKQLRPLPQSIVDLLNNWEQSK